LILKPLNAQGYGGLRDEQPFGRCAEGTGIGDLQEGLEKGDVHAFVSDPGSAQEQAA
jgi:hypothetical protein